jgi:hypothetical protein
MKKKIEAILAGFPEVLWDRWGGDIKKSVFFGWIQRDLKSDFMLIKIEDGELTFFATSSPVFSGIFAQRLGIKNHNKCKRIEDHFKAHCIKLRVVKG